MRPIVGDPFIAHVLTQYILTHFHLGDRVEYEGTMWKGTVYSIDRLGLSIDFLVRWDDAHSLWGDDPGVLQSNEIKGLKTDGTWLLEPRVRPDMTTRGELA